MKSILSSALLAAISLAASTASAVVPSDQLMSDDARGYASIPNIEELATKWNQTQMGHLVRDEAMKPFMEDLKRQLRRKITGVKDKLGIELSDLRDVAGGEIGLGLVEYENERAVVTLTVDVTGNDAKLAKLLKKINKELTKRDATKDTAEYAGTALTIYTIPTKSEKDVERTAVYFVKDNMLCACDNRNEAEQMVRRFEGGDCLANIKAYQATMQQCKKEANGIDPQLRWYLDPFGYARSVRSFSSEDEKSRGKDYVAILSSQGFEAIKGAGGYVSLSVGGAYELLHRTSVYAPPVEGVPEKYELAMRMMEFPNSENLVAQDWLPRKLACYRTFNCNLGNAFENFDTLFDAIAGYEDAFAGVLEGLEKDPYGPQVDVREDFIAHLGQRLTLVTDYEVPITPKCERFLLVIEVSNEAAIADTVKKFMESDRNAIQTDFQGNVVWEIREAQQDVPDLDIAVADLDLLEPIEAAPVTEGGSKDGALASSAVCVADDHLFIASHSDFLKEVLGNESSQAGLSSAGDYREVNRAMSQLSPGDAAARFFMRTDEAYRPVYELLRQGKMPESETLLGRILNRLLTPPDDEEEGILREQKIDGRQLPDFEMVRRYFSPAGTLVRSHEDGWFVVGATLSKLAPQARAETSSEASPGTVRK